MNSSEKTARAFDAMRKAPVEIPLEKIEQFVIAGAATGLFASAASKFAFKFHLNTIIAVASAVTATAIAGLVFLAGAGSSEKGETRIPASKEQRSILPQLNEKQAEAPAVPIDSPAANPSRSSVAARSAQVDSGTVAPVAANADQYTAAVNTGDSSENGNEFVFSFNGQDHSYTPMCTRHPVSICQVKDGPEVITCSSAGNGNCATVMAISHPAVYAPRSIDSLQLKLEEQLLKDGLISDRDHYTFSIDGRGMRVNGQRQPEATWKQYKDFIESHSRNKVNRHFSYELTVAGKNITLNVENYISD